MHVLFKFADDTSLFYTSKHLNTLVNTINDELDKINEWLICNKLSINIKKLIISFFVIKIKSFPIYQLS